MYHYVALITIFEYFQVMKYLIIWLSEDWELATPEERVELCFKDNLPLFNLHETAIGY